MCVCVTRPPRTPASSTTRDHTRAQTAADAERFEDRRDRLTVGFSIRLCGSPGSPTTNSVCGRSLMGKAFGVEAESSWGWENFLTSCTTAEPPWSTGDVLRFSVVLDIL